MLFILLLLSNKKIIKFIFNLNNSKIFHEKVDPIKLRIPDYFNFVKNPMDLSTIQKKLKLY